ncbi:MAG: thiamine phosphate synthase [Lachnospiraceae bacterium]|nr:thiamine phosphate synthase [Lachnospiraceae bacterium]
MKCKKEWMRLYAVTDRAWAVRQESEETDDEIFGQKMSGEETDDRSSVQRMSGKVVGDKSTEQKISEEEDNDRSSEQRISEKQVDDLIPGEKTLKKQVEAAIRGGVTCVQLREKNLPREKFLAEAIRMAKLCRSHQVPFVVNDDPEIALLSGADGVHIGQDDMKIADVRRLLGADKLIGVSAHTVEEAVAAEKSGADYLGVGAVFTTSTKSNVRALSMETLRDICRAVAIPVVAIGGITKDNAMQLAGSGVDGIAVVSAIFAEKDCRKAAADLRGMVDSMIDLVPDF